MCVCLIHGWIRSEKLIKIWFIYANEIFPKFVTQGFPLVRTNTHKTRGIRSYQSALTETCRGRTDAQKIWSNLSIRKSNNEVKHFTQMPDFGPVLPQPCTLSSPTLCSALSSSQRSKQNPPTSSKHNYQPEFQSVLPTEHKTHSSVFLCDARASFFISSWWSHTRVSEWVRTCACVWEYRLWSYPIPKHTVKRTVNWTPCNLRRCPV